MTVMRPWYVLSTICIPDPGLGDLIGVWAQLFPCVGSAAAVAPTQQAAAALGLLTLFSKLAF